MSNNKYRRQVREALMRRAKSVLTEEHGKVVPQQWTEVEPDHWAWWDGQIKGSTADVRKESGQWSWHAKKTSTYNVGSKWDPEPEWDWGTDEGTEPTLKAAQSAAERVLHGDPRDDEMEPWEKADLAGAGEDEDEEYDKYKHKGKTWW